MSKDVQDKLMNQEEKNQDLSPDSGVRISAQIDRRTFFKSTAIG